MNGNKPGNWTKLQAHVRRLLRPYHLKDDTKHMRRFLKWCHVQKQKRAWNRKRRRK